MKATISLCMIVRNEEANLTPCLSDLASLVDEIIVVDTGSTDNTKRVAASLGAKVFDFQWIDDFSAARNFGVERASGDWIFWLDGDDRIDATNRAGLANLFSSLQSQTMPRNSCFLMSCALGAPNTPAQFTMSHVRLFRRDSDIRFRRRVHEQPCVEDGADMTVFQTDLVIYHAGYEDDRAHRQKLRRNLRLLQIEHATRPRDSATLFYMAESYVMLDEYADAIEYFRRALRCDDARNATWAPHAHRRIGSCLHSLGKQEEALSTLRSSVEAFPDDLSLLFALGQVLTTIGHCDEAVEVLNRLAAAPAPATVLWGTEPGIQSEKCRLWLGSAHAKAGRLQDAEVQYRMALAFDPRCATAWRQLGWLYLTMDRRTELEIAIQQLSRLPDGQREALLLAAKSLLNDGRFREARPYVEEALLKFPRDERSQLLFCDFLYGHCEDVAACIEAHLELLTMNPAYVQTVQARFDNLRRLHPAAASIEIPDPAVAMSAPAQSSPRAIAN